MPEPASPMATTRCACWRADPAELVAALCDPALVARWRERTRAELPVIAERRLAATLRRLDLLAARLEGEGLEVLAAADAAGADALLTDLFAVATWDGWPLPAVALGELEIEVDGLRRGLLGADRAEDGAQLYVVDAGTVALARCRSPLAEDAS